MENKATEAQVEKWIVEWYVEDDLTIEAIYTRLRLKLVSKYTRDRIADVLRSKNVPIYSRRSP